MSTEQLPLIADPAATLASITDALAAAPSDPVDAYVYSCACASKTNPGRPVGVYLARRGTRVRTVAVNDIGVGSVYRGVMVTILRALRSERAAPLPIIVRCNQLPAIQTLHTMQRYGDCSSDEVGAIRDAVRAADVPVTFEFVPNAAGDTDITAAREAASNIVAAQRRTA